MTTTIESAASIHPWATSFGAPPYTFLGVKRTAHNARGEDGWLAEGGEDRPGGTCDVCGACITYSYRLRSSTGTEFVVGSDCVRKASRDYDGTLDERSRRMILDAEKEAKRAAKVDRLKSAAAAKYADLAALLRTDNLADRFDGSVALGMATTFIRFGTISEKQVAWLRRMLRK